MICDRRILSFCLQDSARILMVGFRACTACLAKLDPVVARYQSADDSRDDSCVGTEYNPEP